MNLAPKPKIALTLLLSFTLLATGCTAQWISVALADLPVLTQMALNIATIVSSLQSGNQVSAAEAASIQNISSQASKDLNLVQSLYKQYKSSPNSTILQQIQSAIADIDQNLPALVQAAQISDPVLASRITAAVNLILTTVESFSVLIPQTAAASFKAEMRSQKASSPAISVPRAKELKSRWNQEVCAPTGNAGFDSAFAFCEIN
jgi:hypothetical protein